MPFVLHNAWVHCVRPEKGGQAAALHVTGDREPGKIDDPRYHCIPNQGVLCQTHLPESFPEVPYAVVHIHQFSQMVLSLLRPVRTLARVGEHTVPRILIKVRARMGSRFS